ncbi:hypothetical protein VAR608DRAFT_6335 [Variovorax sp. HW608]|uniref:DUF1488 family protein n=1 Tax=Variovorax sp. HW608 TaxID=1034889 RepID=UPI0008200623|nr:DUF1488 family protein [Variovorax sp. HW608]SCK58950.1 hypothetical protein VAR608DRAFT_6335 [Variovorax sp. HW608]
MFSEAIHCRDTQTVRFAIYPDGFDGPRIIARISDDALHRIFGARRDDANLAAACQAHFDRIEAKALERHHAAPLSAVWLRAVDFRVEAEAELSVI